MDTSTSAYRLMELIAISGECSPRVLAHLHLSTSYGKNSSPGSRRKAVSEPTIRTGCGDTG